VQGVKAVYAVVDVVAMPTIVREEAVFQAARWLGDDRVKALDFNVKVEYLLTKGLTGEEVAQAMRRVELKDESSVFQTQRRDSVQWQSEGEAPDDADDDIAEEEVMTALRGQILQTLYRMHNYGQTAGHQDGPAHNWHSTRRAAMMLNPDLKALLRDCSVNRLKDLVTSLAVTVAIVGAHLLLAYWLSRYASSASRWKVVGSVLLASATVGGQCAYVLQAFNHELHHMSFMVSLPTFAKSFFRLVSFSMGSAGAALCHVPWAAYYFGGGHHRHHKYVGSQRDVDEDALFFLWQPSFPGVFKRLLWLSFAAVSVPIVMGVSLLMCARYDFKANRKELFLLTLDLSLTITVHYMVGSVGAAYLLLSSFFSMGFLCHPLVGFWLLQHLCVIPGNGSQPTVSYYGSHIWNWLCLNELLHVEHHDFAGVSWLRLPRLREIAPDFYETLYVENSIFGLILRWARDGDTETRDGLFSWDFACRTHWGYMRRPPAPPPVTRPVNKAKDTSSSSAVDSSDKSSSLRQRQGPATPQRSANARNIQASTSNQETCEL
jgi:sphingolipid delta-4 desaturase